MSPDHDDKFLFSTLGQLNDWVADLQNKVTDVRIELAIIKTKIAMWATLFGFLGALAAQILITLYKKG